MEIPTDVLTQIRDYANPLPRRAISSYWTCPTGPDNHDHLQEMITNVHIAFAEYITKRNGDNDPDIVFSSRGRDFNAPDLGIWTGVHTLYYNPRYYIEFTMDDVMRWNGQFDGFYHITLEHDEDMHFQVYTTKWKTLPEEPDLSYYWHHDY